ncbi:biliverdin reductase A-like [Mercenaria mercenaria]|uniref:biliverdin reductase A-like n=1 Tax=Mercenaria mercenaria TaxID=6596 RepID=UPI00234EA07B|nr:biliverdin reductase A-like [Mercenaria mercenaria]
MTTRSLGAVVFGAGIAGKVRIRDILSCDGENIGAKLVGFVSRRQLAIDGATQITEDEALHRPEVDAVLICTEPCEHEHVIRKAFGCGKHVLVEFPVCTSASVTAELSHLAEEKGLVLHEENIALLTPGFLALKEKLLNARSPLVKGEIHLTGSYNGWVEDFEKSGGPFCVNVSLIQTLYELVGNDLHATGGQLEVTDTGFVATAKLACSKCRDLTLTIRRTKERSKREKQTKFILVDGTVLDDTPGVTPPPVEGMSQPPKKPGLFMQDFLQFVDKVKGLRENTTDTARTLHCVQVADDIHRFMGLNS